MTRYDFIWAGLKLLGVWAGILAVQGFLSIASRFPSAIAASGLNDVPLVPTENGGGATFGDLSMFMNAAVAGLLVRAIGMVLVSWYLLSRTSSLAERLNRAE